MRMVRLPISCSDEHGTLRAQLAFEASECKAGSEYLFQCPNPRVYRSENRILKEVRLDDAGCALHLTERILLVQCDALCTLDDGTSTSWVDTDLSGAQPMQ